MIDIKEDIIYKAALTFKHEELAGMYAIINKREQEYLKEIKLLKEENAKLKEDLLLTQDQLRDAVEIIENTDNTENKKLRDILYRINSFFGVGRYMEYRDLDGNMYPLDLTELENILMEIDV